MKYFLLLIIAFITLTASSQQKISTTESTLIPEGISINPKDGTIYISSIARHKIIRINKSGKVENFIEEGEEGFLEGLGLKVDPKRNLLWALSNQRQGKWYVSQIHGFDLNTKEKKFFHLIKDSVPHLLNDLVLDTDDNVFITDTYFSAVYKFNISAQKLTLFITGPQLKYPNGIALGENKILYVASYGTGMLQIDISSQQIKPLHGYKDSLMAFGLDGLIYDKGALYGIYNAGKDRKTNAVIKYALNEKKERIDAEQIIDRGNSDFYDPTTADLLKNKLYVIANSHLSEYNGNKESITGIENKLLPVAVLVYDLKKYN